MLLELAGCGPTGGWAGGRGAGQARCCAHGSLSATRTKRGRSWGTMLAGLERVLIFQGTIDVPSIWIWLRDPVP